VGRRKFLIHSLTHSLACLLACLLFHVIVGKIESATAAVAGEEVFGEMMTAASRQEAMTTIAHGNTHHKYINSLVLGGCFCTSTDSR